MSQNKLILFTFSCDCHGGSVELGVGPAVSQTRSLALGSFYIYGSPSEFGIYTNSICDAVSNATCLPGSPASGIIQIQNNTGVPLTLTTLTANANSWTMTGAGSATLTLGAGASSSSYESPLTTSALNFSDGIGSCNGAPLANGATCQFYISGNVTTSSTAQGGYTLFPGSISLTVGSSGGNTTYPITTPITFTASAAPALAAQVLAFPYFGDAQISSSSNPITLTRTDTCSVTGGGCSNAASGVVAFMNPSSNVNSVILNNLSASPGTWPLTTSPSSMVTLNVGPADGTAGCTLNASPCSLVAAGCTSPLAPGDMCEVYLGGALTNPPIVEGQYETAPITLTVNYT